MSEVQRSLRSMAWELRKWRTGAAAVWALAAAALTVTLASATPSLLWLWPPYWLRLALRFLPLTWLFARSAPASLAHGSFADGAVPAEIHGVTPALAGVLVGGVLGGTVLAAAAGFALVRSALRLVPLNAVDSSARYLRPKYVLFVGVFGALTPLATWAMLWLRGSELASPLLAIDASPPDATLRLEMTCVDERFVYMFVHSGVLGLVFAAAHLGFERYQLAFPRLALSRRFRIRALVPGLLVRSAKLVALVSRLVAGGWMAVSLAAHGASLAGAAAVAPFLNAATGMPVYALPLLGTPLCATPARWFDPMLSLHIAAASVLVVFIFDLTNSMAEVFLTQPHAFVGGTHSNSSALLIAALEYYDDPLVRHLAFLDLHMVAEFDERRRMALFLDDSGKAWTKLLRRLLEVVDGLTIQMAAWRVRETEALAAVRAGPYTTSTLLYWWFQRHVNPLAKASGAAPYGDDTSYDAWLAARMPDPSQTASLWAILGDAVRVRPLLAALFYRSPAAHTRSLFDDLYLQLWCVGALGKLAAAAKTDDAYGIVQRTLPDLTSALLAVAVELDEQMSTVSVLNPPLTGPLEGHQLVRPQTLALGSVLNTSLYLIVTTYYASLRTFAFPTHYAAKLQQYADFTI
ncbi:uncharacterized protein AMSG_00259 [Thecamonas trahens ATCC 50062]|uniref:Uncharacterized protein n=1 Tax=Thecamonas trahens ATCC 50062 TaxID=461836 RepID=A0A0L0D1R1_THETB|nr:hypothetical protein AMSG_00259 [Thecamonas trahens ATCC 50062]KNC46141.1 hypothetical protein AMSG_00259 [Thecamonas trahens ATCC 50062]|eukprot:XP_013763118.1 hypothetical protein AMSG_00259 [Thecamonas trahens ATCC 50062]